MSLKTEDDDCKPAGPVCEFCSDYDTAEDPCQACGCHWVSVADMTPADWSSMGLSFDSTPGEERERASNQVVGYAAPKVTITNGGKVNKSCR